MIPKTYEEFVFLGFDYSNEEQKDFIEFVLARAKELKMPITSSQIENFVVSTNPDMVEEDEN